MWHRPLLHVSYSMVPIKRTVFFTSVTVHKNTVCLIGNKGRSETPFGLVSTEFVFLDLNPHFYEVNQEV